VPKAQPQSVAGIRKKTSPPQALAAHGPRLHAASARTAQFSAKKKSCHPADVALSAHRHLQKILTHFSPSRSKRFQHLNYFLYFNKLFKHKTGTPIAKKGASRIGRPGKLS
jgi:hypothetical protein